MKSELKELQNLIIDFREKRDWKQFHKIKDLLLALSIEAAELKELFLWKNKNEIELIEKDKIEDEIADVFIYLIYICEECKVDLNMAVRNKINKNNIKYPVEKSKGSIKKYNELN